jgi:hypothetical protein
MFSRISTGREMDRFLIRSWWRAVVERAGGSNIFGYISLFGEFFPG